MCCCECEEDIDYACCNINESARDVTDQVVCSKLCIFVESIRIYVKCLLKTIVMSWKCLLKCRREVRDAKVEWLRECRPEIQIRLWSRWLFEDCFEECMLGED